VEILRLVVGPVMTNCYIVWNERREAMVIDPGGDSFEILSRIGKHELKVLYIVDTHGHIDHIAANAELKEAHPDAELVVHASDEPLLTDPQRNLSMFLGADVSSPPPDMTVGDGDEIALGPLSFRVIHTPGHTRGGISLFCDGESPPVLFCGDTLFQYSVGRTDLPGGDFQTLLGSIRNRLFSLPDDTRVLPGHGPETTIGEEKRLNPFLR